MTNTTNLCPLCKTTSTEYYCSPKKREKYYSCPNCGGVFLAPFFLLSRDDEKTRYLKHQNSDVNNGYLEFIAPVVNYVMEATADTSLGLDFGSGPIPVISDLLRKRGRAINQFDLYFYPDELVLKQRYDYIMACEVVEHFREPFKEFANLRNMLKSDAFLVISTSLLEDQIDFSKWHYVRDPTHIFFYRIKTVEWIEREFKFKSSRILSNRLVVFNI